MMTDKIEKKVIPYTSVPYDYVATQSIAAEIQMSYPKGRAPKTVQIGQVVFTRVGTEPSTTPWESKNGS